MIYLILLCVGIFSTAFIRGLLVNAFKEKPDQEPNAGTTIVNSLLYKKRKDKNGGS